MTNNNLRQVLDTAADMIARQFMGMTYADARKVTPSFEALESDIYGWGDGESPIIQWEEGPYEWTFYISEDLINYLRSQGLFAEPITSWALGLYAI